MGYLSVVCGVADRGASDLRRIGREALETHWTRLCHPIYYLVSRAIVIIQVSRATVVIHYSIFIEYIHTLFNNYSLYSIQETVSVIQYMECEQTGNSIFGGAFPKCCLSCTINQNKCPSADHIKIFAEVHILNITASIAT